ncbi:hypothetical protein GCM10009718_02940 [Isoptericola halotolerans]
MGGGAAPGRQLLTQEVTQHGDPVVARVEVGVVARTGEVDPSGQGAATDQLVLGLRGEQAVIGEDGERRCGQGRPLVPPGDVDRCDHGLHDVGVEPPAQPPDGPLEVGDPGVRERGLSEEGSCRRLVGEDGRPGREELTDRTRRAGIVTGDVPLEHDETVDQVGAGGGGEEGRVRSHRLSDEAHRAGVQLLDHRDDVGDERLAGDVAGPPAAASVTALVDQEHVEAVGERVRGRQELARAACQAVQQDHRRAVAAAVGDGEAHAVPPESQRGRRHRQEPLRSRRMSGKAYGLLASAARRTAATTGLSW